MYLVVNKKSVMLCSMILCGGLVLGGILGAIPERKASGVGRGEDVKIVIDAGHGLPDGGAVGIGGAVEAELNLDIAHKLSEILENMGFTSIMTRTDECGIKPENSDGFLRAA